MLTMLIDANLNQNSPARSPSHVGTVGRGEYTMPPSGEV